MSGGRTGAGRLTGLTRAVVWHRRLLAGGLAAGAVALGLQSLQPAPAPTTDVMAAAGDLSGGAVLGPGDLRTVALPTAVVPQGALLPGDAVHGHVLAGPVRAGEPLTDVRLVGPSLVDGWGGDVVAAPVRVADAGAVALVRPGDRVDLIATATTGEAGARVVAADVPVLATPRTDDSGGGLTEGALIVVASTRAQAGELATAAVTSRLSLTLRAVASDP